MSPANHIRKGASVSSRQQCSTSLGCSALGAPSAATVENKCWWRERVEPNRLPKCASHNRQSNDASLPQHLCESRRWPRFAILRTCASATGRHAMRASPTRTSMLVPSSIGRFAEQSPGGLLGLAKRNADREHRQRSARLNRKQILEQVLDIGRWALTLMCADKLLADHPCGALRSSQATTEMCLRLQSWRHPPASARQWQARHACKPTRPTTAKTLGKGNGSRQGHVPRDIASTISLTPS